jgi:uncharacterized protein with HEPN domain
MSQRTDDQYLVDLLDAADAIGASLRGVSADQCADDPDKRGAVLWRLMVIGEASGRLSAGVTSELADVPWDQIRGFRNRVVHGYFALNWPVVWQIATVEVPRLRQGVEALLIESFPETHRRWEERRARGETEVL